MPIFSVIIPAYNSEKFIGETIESVLAQTFTDFELIIVNDGSKDKTGDIIAKFKKNDSRVKILTTLNSGIPAIAANVGINTAKGKYIAFLDHDDLWKKNKLETCYGLFLSNPEIGFIANDVEIFSESTQLTAKSGAPVEINKLSTENILSGNYFNTFSMLAVKRDVFDKIGFLDTNLLVFADYEMIIRMTSCNIPHIFLSEPLVTYRVHPNNTSAINKSGNRRVEDLKYIINKHKTIFSEHKKSLSVIFHAIARLQLYLGNKKESILYFKKAVACDKYNPMAYARLLLSYFGDKYYSFSNTLKNKTLRVISQT